MVSIPPQAGYWSKCDGDRKKNSAASPKSYQPNSVEKMGTVQAYKSSSQTIINSQHNSSRKNSEDEKEIRYFKK